MPPSRGDVIVSVMDPLSLNRVLGWTNRLDRTPGVALGLPPELR
jgi:hypothetical protein